MNSDTLNSNEVKKLKISESIDICHRENTIEIFDGLSIYPIKQLASNVFLSYYVRKKMVKTPIVSYQFVEVPANMQEIVKDIVQKNLEGKMDSYFKKIYTKKDTAEIRIDYTIAKNKLGKWKGDFKFNYDGELFKWTTGEGGFKIIEDIPLHAFDHFKTHLSNKSEEPRKAK